MKRMILAFLQLLLLSSCLKDMDPFEGGDGIRANLNGAKCVMMGYPGNSVGASYSEGNTFTFNTGEVMMTAFTTGQKLRFQITVSDDAALVVGHKYSVGDKGMTAGVKFVTDNGVGQTVPLNGWISFLQVGPEVSTTEARFELTGTTLSGDRIEFRHGFLRLYTDRGGGR